VACGRVMGCAARDSNPQPLPKESDTDGLSTCGVPSSTAVYQAVCLPGLPVADPWMPSVCAPSVPHSLSVQQFLELPEVGGHSLPDTWHGDSPQQTARAAEF
jgi:hypothetical protein